MTDIVTRLRNPPFGTETSVRNLMTAAADDIELLRAQPIKTDLGDEPVAWQPKYKPEFVAYLKNTRAYAQGYAPAFFPTRKEAEDYGYGGHDARPLYDHPPRGSDAAGSPFAWWWEDKTGCVHLTLDRPDVHQAAQEMFCEPQPLYGRPPADRLGGNHPDDLAVDRFAAAMKAKLARKRAEGRGGWDNPDECSIAFLAVMLRTHIAKGDPVDVGNFAMMIHQRGGMIE